MKTDGSIAFAAYFIFLALFISPSRGWELKLQSATREPSQRLAPSAALPPEVVYCFFSEAFVAGGFQYAYPQRSKVLIDECVAKNGEVSLRFDLDPGDFSGGSVCLYNMVFDLKPYYNKGALRFWIKGAAGNEIAWIGLVDDEKSDMRKTVVRLPVFLYGGVGKEWTRICIPLRHFGMRGVYWDAKTRLEIPNAFDWDKVAEFRIEVKKKENKRFRVWVDDIFIVKDIYDPSKDKCVP